MPRSPIRLGVNIDHVATVRHTRRGDEPDPVAAAVLALLGGADSITVHLREDRRHIQDRDVRLLRPVVPRLNFEMAVADEIVESRAEAGLVVARPIRMEAKQASSQIAALAGDIRPGRTIRNEFPRPTDANDRVLGTELAGAIARSRIFEDGPESNDETLASLEFNGGSVAGQGLGAFNAYGVSIRVEGGAQDGVGKAMLGGVVSVLKGKGAKGKRLTYETVAG